MTSFEYSEDANPGFDRGNFLDNAPADQPGVSEPYAAVTAPDSHDTIPDIEDAPPDAGDVPIVPVRRPFGELTVETREATHPFLRAEDVDRAELDAYYHSTATMSDNRQAWYDIERTLANPADPRLDSAAAHVDRSIREHAPVESDPTDIFAGKFANDSDAQQWYEAARVKAFLPAFEARTTEGQVTTEAAGRAYWALVKDVLPDTMTDGNRAEVLVGALAAREGFLTDPNSFLYPSSPREGNNSYRPNGKSLNHDYNMVGDGYKVPVEVKVRGGTTVRPGNYDPQIAIVRFVNDIGPAIIGADLPDAKSVGRAAPLVLSRTEQLMGQELDRSIRVPELDAAARALYNRIAVRQAGDMTNPYRRR